MLLSVLNVSTLWLLFFTCIQLKYDFTSKLIPDELQDRKKECLAPPLGQDVHILASYFNHRKYMAKILPNLQQM